MAQGCIVRCTCNSHVDIFTALCKSWNLKPKFESHTLKWTAIASLDLLLITPIGC